MLYFKYHISCGLLMKFLWFGGGQEVITYVNTNDNTVTGFEKKPPSTHNYKSLEIPILII